MMNGAESRENTKSGSVISLTLPQLITLVLCLATGVGGGTFVARKTTEDIPTNQEADARLYKILAGQERIAQQVQELYNQLSIDRQTQHELERRQRGYDAERQRR